MKAVNVDDVLKILHKYGKYIFVTDEKKYSSMIDEIANLKAISQEPRWIPVSDPLNELPKDKQLLVTVEEEIFPGKNRRYVTELYYDMTEWSDINDAENAIAYQYYPEAYKEADDDIRTESKSNP